MATDSVSEEVTIAAGIEDVFRTITYWCSGRDDEIRHCEILSGERHAPAVVAYQAEALGRGIDYTIEYSVEPPRRVEYRLVRSSLLRRLDGRYDLGEVDAAATSCRYSLTAELRFPLPGFLKRRVAHIIVDRALHALKVEAESGDGAEG